MEYLTFKENGLVCGHGNSKGESTRDLINGKLVMKKSYQTWTSMLERCYSEKFHKRKPNYIGCRVSDDWLSYVSFKKWFDLNHIEGYRLDKDILSGSSTGKLYSKETCKFVSRQENNAHIDRSNLNAKCYIVTLPSGNEIEVFNLKKYCKENNLHQSNMAQVAKGKLKQNKGYLCRYA